MLALLGAQEFGQGFRLQADPLATAASAARKAVEYGPSNHLAHFSLAQVLFFQKDFETFRNVAARAAALNPMDGNAIAFLGELLTYSGDAERGLALAARAKELNPHHPGWYWYADVYDAFAGATTAARSRWRARSTCRPLRRAMMIAAACGWLGEREAATRALRELVALRPDISAIARQEAQKWWPPEYAERLIEGLRRAGLEIPATADAPAASASAPSARGSDAAAPGSPSSTKAPEATVAIAVLPFADMSAATTRRTSARAWPKRS